MELRECYQAMGGNYDNAMRRLAKEDRVRRFLLLFLKDGSFQTLEQAVKEQDWGVVFRAAHTLKGTAMNLDIDRLASSASELTEAVRNGVPKVDVLPMFEKIQVDYRAAIDAISLLK